MIVKVCGMRDGQNVANVAALGVSMMGFILYDRSPRFVGDVAPSTPDGVRRVGVFVNASTECIVACVAKHHLDVVQLHGGESVAQCRELRDRGVDVIKAISVGGPADVERAAEYESQVDYLLFDTKCAGYGGSGVSFDWGVLDLYRGATPFLLSGGVDESMLEALLLLDHPRFVGVDLNSRFEIAPAIKDVDRLKNFIDKLL